MRHAVAPMWWFMRPTSNGRSPWTLFLPVSIRRVRSGLPASVAKRVPTPLLLAAFMGISSAAMAQEPLPVLVVPDPEPAAAEDSRAGPRVVPLDALPLDEMVPDPSPIETDPPETALPDAISTGVDMIEIAPADTVPGADFDMTVDRAARPAGVVAGGPAGDAAEVPTIDTLAAPAADGRFAPCPDGLLKAAYAQLLSETVLRTYAIEAEVLRLCAERQAQINRILKLETELESILAATARPPSGGLAVTDAPTLPRASVTVPGSSEGPPDDAAASVPDASVTAAPDPVLGSAAASPSSAGSWQHLVRYRVRVAGGAWRAGIASTYRPPLPPPVVLEDGTLMPVTPLAPEPPLELVVAAGDRLEDGLIVEAITDEAVMVRGDGDDGEPRRLRNDPGPAPARAQDNAGCTADNADPREFVYCTVAAGDTPGVASQ